MTLLTRRLVHCCLWSALVSSQALGADWPTFRHDSRRSGRTAERIDAARLRPQWAWQSPHLPMPAWHGPAKWDAFHNMRGLKSMRNYDPCFHVVGAGGAVFFGSSADDTVRCLDAATGKVRWQFPTDGPVRMAPTLSGGKVFFGSDDGYAYCLNAADGRLVWRYSPRPDRRLVIHNGRMISFWPVRTGVLVEGGVASFGAAMLPWRESLLCAVDAATGEAKGAGRYVASLGGVTMEGALLASGRLLVVPQGRVSPLFFDLATGKRQAGIKKGAGGGGCFALLTDDATLLHGPGNKTGWITASSTQSRTKIASYPGASAMVVAGKTAYVLTDKHLAAFDRAKRQRLWQVSCTSPFELILAGDTLFAGGADEVAAFRAADGERFWTGRVRGRAYGLAVANGALLVSTDEGQIACFRPTGGAPPARAESPAPTNVPRTPPKPVVPDKDPALIGRWVFHRSTGLDDQGRVPPPATDPTRVKDLNGTQHGSILGNARIVAVGDREAIELDGATASVQLATDHTKAVLPTRAMTAEAWVRVDKPLAWGGIIGAMQDNGNYEKGWVLGYRGASFTFALAAKSGAGSLGYLNATTSFTPRRWHHVVGTYDGAAKRTYVNGALAGTASAQKGDIDYPPQAFYEIGAYHDKNEYFRMTGQIHEVRVYRRALTAAEIKAHFEAKRQSFPLPPPPPPEPHHITLASGPYLQFVGPDAALVRWRTREPCPSIVEYAADGETRTVKDPKPKTLHALTLPGLRYRRIYTFQIHATVDGKPGVTKKFECDTFFNYGVPVLPDRSSPLSAAAPLHARAAEAILDQTNVRQGICLVLGCGEGRLAYELAKRSQLRVLGVDTDPRKVDAARRALLAAGAYGARVSVRRVASLDKLPFPPCFANLVVSEHVLTNGECAGRAAELFRVLRPGGVACIGQPKGAPKPLTRQALEAWFRSTPAKATVAERDGGRWATLTRPPLAGIGEWSHQYGQPDNSAFGGETLDGARNTGQLVTQWIGRPGPRAQADRNGRKPSPLALDGRLFLQGLERIIAIDAYNGTILWALETPGLLRFNVPRDSSNWCADRQHLFAALRGRAWRIDAATGVVSKRYAVVPGPNNNWQYDWGFVGRYGDKLVGSAVKQGTVHTNFWGGGGWYDAKGGPLALKVCSDSLFALDKASGKTAWAYAKGLVINPTITIGDGTVYFVETRNPKARAAESRRVGPPGLWQDQFLVALDAHRGMVRWEKPIDTADGHTAFYMAYGSGTLVIVSSAPKMYHVYAYRAADGEALWNTSFKWPKDNHGWHMSRPAIVGDRVYVRPSVLALATGKTVGTMPGGGCGTYAATTQALFYRSGTVNMWDPKGGKVTKWARLRPDCWVSTIPACGMVLSPEGGGGCSCGSWMETSIGFMPASRK